MLFKESYFKQGLMSKNRLITSFKSLISESVNQYREKNKLEVEQQLNLLVKNSSNFITSRSIKDKKENDDNNTNDATQYQYIHSLNKFPQKYKLCNLLESRKYTQSIKLSNLLLKEYNTKYSHLDSIVLDTELDHAMSLLYTSNKFEDSLNTVKNVICKSIISNNTYIRTKALAVLGYIYNRSGNHKFSYEIGEYALKSYTKSNLTCTHLLFLILQLTLGSLDKNVISSIETQFINNLEKQVPSIINNGDNIIARSLSVKELMEEFKKIVNKDNNNKDISEIMQEYFTNNCFFLGFYYLNKSKNITSYSQLGNNIRHNTQAINLLEAFELSNSSNYLKHSTGSNSSNFYITNRVDNKLLSEYQTDNSYNLISNAEFIESTCNSNINTQSENNLNTNEKLAFFKTYTVNSKIELAYAYLYRFFLNSQVSRSEYYSKDHINKLEALLVNFPHEQVNFKLAKISTINNIGGSVQAYEELCQLEKSSIVNESTIMKLSILNNKLSVLVKLIGNKETKDKGFNSDSSNSKVMNNLIETYFAFNKIHDEFFGNNILTEVKYNADQMLLSNKLNTLVKSVKSAQNSTNNQNNSSNLKSKSAKL